MPDITNDLVAVAAVLYFVPTAIALVRWHHNVLAITAVNLLLGWTAIGWVLAFIWSLTAKRPRRGG